MLVFSSSIEEQHARRTSECLVPIRTGCTVYSYHLVTFSCFGVYNERTWYFGSNRWVFRSLFLWLDAQLRCRIESGTNVSPYKVSTLQTEPSGWSAMDPVLLWHEQMSETIFLKTFLLLWLWTFGDEFLPCNTGAATDISRNPLRANKKKLRAVTRVYEKKTAHRCPIFLVWTSQGGGGYYTTIPPPKTPIPV